MSKPSLALAVVIACAACNRGCCGPEPVAYVDAPTTLPAVRAMARPPAVTVAVRTETRAPSGGGGCGHSPLCVLILPVLVYESLVPDRFQLATVTDRGTVVYQAAFDMHGRFLYGQVRKDDAWRVLRVLPLERLGERPIVEVERRSTRDGGGVEATPILPQVDLLSHYAAASARARTEYDRRALWLEAVRILGAEVVPGIRARHATSTPTDPERAALLEHVCPREGPLPRTDALRAALLDGAALHGGPEAVTAAAACAARGAPEPPPWAATMVRRLAPRACEPEPGPTLSALSTMAAVDDTRLGHAAPAGDQPYRTMVLAAVSCADPRGYLLRIQLGGNELPFDLERHVQAATTDPAGPAFVVWGLQRALRAGPDAGARYLRALFARARPDTREAFGVAFAEDLALATPPADPVLETFLELYATPDGPPGAQAHRAALLDALFDTDRSIGRDRRAHSIPWLARRAATLPPGTSARRLVEVARLRLGVDDALTEVLRGMPRPRSMLRVIRERPRRPGAGWTLEDVVLYGLARDGCGNDRTLEEGIEHVARGGVLSGCPIRLPRDR